MRHVSLDQVAGGESTAEGQLTRQDGCRDNASKAAGVVSGVGGVRSSDAEQLQHGSLGVQDGATAKGADFQRGHGNGDLERAAETGQWLAYD